MSDPTRESDERQLPAWLLGLIIAVVLFVIGIFVFGALGFGDNPVLEEGSIPALWLLGRKVSRLDISAL